MNPGRQKRSQLCSSWLDEVEKPEKVRLDGPSIYLRLALKEPGRITANPSRPARPYDLALGELRRRRQAQTTRDLLRSQVSAQPERHVNIGIGYDNLTTHPTILDQRPSAVCAVQARNRSVRVSSPWGQVSSPSRSPIMD